MSRLQGVRVLVTRPAERAQELCFLLEEEGAEVACLPLLELLPPSDGRPLQSAAEQLSRFRWVLFSSPTGVEALFEASRLAGTLEAFARVKVGAVGPGTARAAHTLKLPVTRVAENPTGEGLFEAVVEDVEPGEEVLLPAAEEGRAELSSRLTAAGVRVTRVAAYRSAPTVGAPEDWSGLSDRLPGVVLFGSPRTVQAFLDGPPPVPRQVLAQARCVAIGPTTEAAMRELGITAHAVARAPTAMGLVEAAAEALSA